MDDILVYGCWFLVVYGAVAVLRDVIKLVIYLRKPRPSYGPLFRMRDRQ